MDKHNVTMYKVLVVLVLICSVNSANILVLMSVPSPSHFLLIRPIVNNLASRGHNVTVLSVNTDFDPPVNVSYIHLENTYNVLNGNGTVANNILKRGEENPFQATMSFYRFGTLGCIGATSSKGWQTLQDYPDTFHFDLIIYDFTTGPCVLGFLHKFNYPPLISITGFSIPQFSHYLVGGYKPSSTVPHFTMLYDSDMTFSQRMYNFVVQNFDSIYRQWVFLPRIQRLAQKASNFPLPNLGALEEHTQLMLVNSNPVVDPAEILPQNVIAVGGLQIVQPKPLPEEIAKFIENSRKGAVLFAMGTNFKSKMFTPERQAMFIEAFNQLPEYNFLWKFDDENLPMPASNNLMVTPWLPQNDILAHPNVKAFISHCGMLSTYEASFHGVPIVGLPIYVDQHRNAQRTVRAGVGVALDMKTLSADKIRQALLQVLEDSQIQSKMKKRSALLKDQPEKPIDRALWWIEWVLRHPHSNHLRSPLLKLNYLAKNNLDVFSLLTTIIVIVFIAGYKCLKNTRKTNIKTLDTNKKLK
ncbi:UDP-glucosyltransferase 2-like [Uranotaenia lowii]|uniref:UDP-glucosyltransferase 2-like n=1 Tax=Uranotaenia lowii TaxID=190385 RepID=UPI002479349D|nr:UDP-glucosyltransferase 2-like [Uranotaenia lowii]